MDFVDHQRSSPGDSSSGRFLILSDDAGRDFRLLSLPETVINKPIESRFENPHEVLPHLSGRLIETIEVFDRGVIVIYVENARQMIGRLNINQGKIEPVEMGEVAYSITAAENHCYEADSFQFNFESLITPTQTCEIDLESGEIRVLKRREVPGYDPQLLVQERIEATASDGTKIPITLVRHRDHRDGSNPLLLEVYGAYGISNWPWWDETRLSLLNRGMGFAIAHVRGGAEGGRGWHDQAKLLMKETTFTDTIACVNALVERGITSRDRLVLTGASAGGLTVGAVLNMEPDICRAALIGVPFVDVLNTMLDESLPLTTQEYFEWGNPKEKPFFDVMKRYSPYDNLRPTRYPDVLVYSSYNDGQVMYWEPAKYVARLRGTRVDDGLTLLSMTMTGGHQGPSGRRGAMREIARQYAFALFRVGLTH
jgi:oligopeptidase B